MNQWFVVHTQPQKELFAAQELSKQGFDVYYPKFEKTRRHARRTDTIISPFFPRYIFISFDRDTTPWRCINGTRGVIHILTNNGKPTNIPTSIIQDMKSQETASGLVPVETLSLFTVNEKVHIVGGALEGYSATVVALSDQQRVQLLIDFMGRQLQVQLPLHMIEAA